MISKQENFSIIVQEIMNCKKSNINTQTLESKLDLMIYNLYDLNYKEVLLIDPEFNLTKEEYENYRIK